MTNYNLDWPIVMSYFKILSQGYEMNKTYYTTISHYQFYIKKTTVN